MQGDLCLLAHSMFDFFLKIKIFYMSYESLKSFQKSFFFSYDLWLLSEIDIGYEKSLFSLNDEVS